MQSRSIIPDTGPEASAAVHFLKGDTIYRQDDFSPYWFEILSGVVRTVHLFMDGRRQITGFFCTGDIFGADSERYRATAEAVSGDIWIRRFRWGVSGQDTCAMERALDSAENSIRLLGYRTADARIAAFILDLYFRLGANDHVDVVMSRSDIADYLGLTTGTVSRTFADLMRRGLIAQSDGHLVRMIDLERLRIVAGACEADRRDKGEYP